VFSDPLNLACYLLAICPSDMLFLFSLIERRYLFPGRFFLLPPLHELSTLFCASGDLPHRYDVAYSWRLQRFFRDPPFRQVVTALVNSAPNLIAAHLLDFLPTHDFKAFGNLALALPISPPRPSVRSVYTPRAGLLPHASGPTSWKIPTAAGLFPFVGTLNNSLTPRPSSFWTL